MPASAAMFTVPSEVQSASSVSMTCSVMFVSASDDETAAAQTANADAPRNTLFMSIASFSFYVLKSNTIIFFSWQKSSQNCACSP